jgi:hypothetical protein
MAGHKRSGMKQKSVQDLALLGHFAKTDIPLLATNSLPANLHAEQRDPGDKKLGNENCS